MNTHIATAGASITRTSSPSSSSGNQLKMDEGQFSETPSISYRGMAPGTSTFLLFDLGRVKYKLKRPLLLCAEYEDGIMVVSGAWLNVYGAGKSRDKAITDYCDMLIDRFEHLSAQEGNLGLGLAKELEKLQAALD